MTPSVKASATKWFTVGFVTFTMSFSFGWFVRGSDNSADARLHEFYRMNKSLADIAGKLQPAPCVPKPEPKYIYQKTELTEELCTKLNWGDSPNYASASKFEVLSMYPIEQLDKEGTELLKTLKLCQKLTKLIK